MTECIVLLLLTPFFPDLFFSPDGDGTRVDYTADFRMQGFAKLFEPFMGGMFEKLSVEAMEGLKETLG